MDLLKVTEDLIRFRTETGNAAEIDKALEYIKNLFAGTEAKVTIFRQEGVSPVIFIRNRDVENYDVLCLGHIDVVPAEDHMFQPYVKDGKMFGRGTLDMKSFAAVALNSMFHVLENKLPLDFGVILSTDEEKGSASTHAFMNAHPSLSANNPHCPLGVEAKPVQVEDGTDFLFSIHQFVRFEVLSVETVYSVVSQKPHVAFLILLNGIYLSVA